MALNKMIRSQVLSNNNFITYLMANRNSLAQKFNTNINKCDICFSEYNRREKQPVIICTMHHTVCRECMTGLESTRKCPFCREFINFSKVVVNNYIFELLPNDPQAPNNRVEINRPIQQSFQQQQPYQPISPRQEIVQEERRNINYEPAQPVYPPNYYPPAPPPFQYHPNDLNPNALNDYEIQMHERPFDTSDCCNSIRNKLGFDFSAEREGLYITILILQLPFFIFDLYFSLSGTDPKCYDKPYESKAYVLRPWLFAMAMTQGSIMLFLMFSAALKICGAISLTCLKCCEYICIGALAIKILLWLYMELALFSAVIAPHCSGGVFAYGVFQTVIHGILLLIIFCLSACK